MQVQGSIACPFKIGDLVTGTARHYERSIYRLIKDLDGHEGIYRIVSYKGKVFKDDPSNGKLDYNREHSEFRLPTWMEIKISSTRSHHRLFDMLELLGIRSARNNRPI